MKRQRAMDSTEGGYPAVVAFPFSLQSCSSASLSRSRSISQARSASCAKSCTIEDGGEECEDKGDLPLLDPPSLRKVAPI